MRFRGADPRTGKVNLSVGVYQDAEGAQPGVLATVTGSRAAHPEAASRTKAYLCRSPVMGPIPAKRRVLVFGGDACIASGRVASVHTPGGTGALRFGR